MIWQRKKLVWVGIVLLLAAWVIRIAWVNIQFHAKYHEEVVPIGTDFPDGDILVCVNSIVRSEYDDQRFLVTAEMTLKNPSDQEAFYYPEPIQLCSEWFYVYANSDMSQTTTAAEADEPPGYLAPHSEKTVSLVYDVPRAYLQESWENWESVPIFLSFIETTTWKKVYVP